MNATRTGLAIASLAALATLTACGNATDGDDKASKENTGTPTGQVSETPQTPAKPGVIDLTKLEQGDAPGVAWIAGGDIHTADGDGLDLPGGSSRQLAPLGDDRWLTTNFQAGEVVLSGPGGEQLGAWPTGGAFVVNSEGSAAAWVSDTGIPMVLAEGATRPTQLPELDGGASYAAVGLLGAETVFANVTYADGASAFQSSTAGGETEAASHSLLRGADVFEDAEGVRLVGHTSIEDDGSCSAQTGPQADSPAWETCDFSVDDFSADGSKLLAGPAYRDGFGDKEIAILDATDGTVLAEPQVADAATVTGSVWEDADHVLAVVYQDGEWAVVRIGTDGSVELALAPQAGGEEDGLVLQTR